MMHWDHGYPGGWGWILMAISMILFWGLVIAGVVALVRYLGRTGAPHAPGPDHGRINAEHILAERFARGEIDETEYEQRLQALRRGGAQPPAR